MVKLTERMVEVVILIGRDRLSYKAAAKCIARRDGDGTISPRTVERYAKEIRDMMQSRLSPRDALTAYYWRHSEELQTSDVS